MMKSLHPSTPRNLRSSLVVLVATASLLAMAACASSGGSAAPSASGSVMRIGWGEVPDNLDPAVSSSQTTFSLDSNIFQTLIFTTPSGDLTPDLATSWKVSDDGLTYTFTLRQGVSFQDGTPFNAAAVVSNFEYITASSTQSVSALTSLGSCLSATATATYTLQVHCTSPYAPLLYNLGTPIFSIQSPESIKKFGGKLQFHLVGTGPFRLVKYVPLQSLELDRWDKFDWAPPALDQKGPAKTAKLIFDFVPNSGSRVSELTSGQAQVINHTPAAQYAKLASSSKFKTLPVPIAGMGILLPFNVKRFPTDDTAVRQAISYYINRDVTIKTAVQDAYPPLTSPLQKGMLGYTKDVKQYNYDPAKGDKLLTSDGWEKSGDVWTKDGKQLALVLNALSTYDEYGAILESVQSQLAAHGIKASIVSNPVTPWIDLNASGGMNLTALQFSNTDSGLMYSWYVPGQSFQKWIGVNNPDLTKLLKRGQVATDKSVREKAYIDAQNIIMEEAYEIPLHVNQDLVTFTSNISGISYEGSGTISFYQAQVQ